MVKEDPVLVNSRRVSEMLGCSIQAVHNWHRYGAMPVPIVIGNRLFWRKSELLEWIDAGCPKRAEWKKNKQNYQLNKAPQKVS